MDWKDSKREERYMRRFGGRKGRNVIIISKIKEKKVKICWVKGL